MHYRKIRYKTGETFCDADESTKWNEGFFLEWLNLVNHTYHPYGKPSGIFALIEDGAGEMLVVGAEFMQFIKDPQRDYEKDN